MFEICKGVNIDPGTSAQYRDLWTREAVAQPVAAGPCPYLGAETGELRDCASCSGRVRLKVFQCNHPARMPDQVTIHQDCSTCTWRPRPAAADVRAITLVNHLSPGDVLVMTAAVHSLHKANPGKFLTAIDSTCPAVWEHNPDVVKPDDHPEHGFQRVETHYPAINDCNQRGIHMMQAYCEFLESALGVRVPLLANRPLLYLSKQEQSWISQVQEITGRKTLYWVLNGGRKDDYTSKWWGSENYQQVVDLLRGRVLFVQVGEAGHHHPRLKGVIDLVGKTDTRQLIRLCANAQGGLGGVTFLQHIFAALQKPYVCLMGGREPVQWNSYPLQSLMHTVGLLPCCREGGCWKSRTVALGDGDEKDKSLCEQPVPADPPVPRCLDLIRPEEIARKIELTSSLLPL